MNVNENEDIVTFGNWILRSNGDLHDGLGMVKKPDNEFEKSKLIVTFWKRKSELAIEEFDDKKSMLLSDAQSRLSRDDNPGGTCMEKDEAISLLKELKKKVTFCQVELSKAELRLEQCTPHSIKKNLDIAEQNRARLGDFVSSISGIEI